MSRARKIILTLLIVAALFAVGFIIAARYVARRVSETALTAVTGCHATVGNASWMFWRRTLSWENVQLDNPPAFGASPLLVVRNASLELDRAAFHRSELRLKRLTLAVARIGIVEDKEGEMNLAMPEGGALAGDSVHTGVSTDLKFRGIDLLELSVDQIVFTSLLDPSKNREIHFGLDHAFFYNLQKPEDFESLIATLVLKSGADFLITRHQHQQPGLGR